MRIGIFSGIACVGLALVFGASAREMRADVIFSNLGPAGTPYSDWWTVGITHSGTQVVAFPFSPTETAFLTGADLPLAVSNGSNGTIATPYSPLTVYIESDSGGQPGAILDTLTQVGTYPTYTATGVVNFTCSGTCGALDEGTQYWIVGQQTDSANATYWLFNGGDTGAWYFNDVNGAEGPWTSATAGNTFGNFDVTGTEIPEPSSLALLGSGLVGIFAAARRRAWGR